jgi:CBS domain-containing protein
MVRVGFGMNMTGTVRGSRRGSPETEWIMTEDPAQQPAPPRPAQPTAADVMQPALSTVEPEDHAAAAAYLMRHAHATALVVVEDDEVRRPLGLITEADIVRAVADKKDLEQVHIRDLMSQDLTVVTADTTVREAAEAMLIGHFRHLPVVNEAGLIGIVDIGDVCRALLDLPGV